MEKRFYDGPMPKEGELITLNENEEFNHSYCLLANSHKGLLAALQAYQSANGFHHDGDWELYDLAKVAIESAIEIQKN